MNIGHIGSKVRALRGVLGWNQKDLAVRSKVGIRTIESLETGQGNPTIGTLASIAKALGVKAADLIEEGNEVIAAPPAELKPLGRTLDPDQELEAQKEGLRLLYTLVGSSWATKRIVNAIVYDDPQYLRKLTLADIPPWLILALLALK